MNFKISRNKFIFLAILSICLSFLPTLSAFAKFSVPKPVGYVNDFANVMTKDNIRQLDGLIYQLKEKTTAEMAVVTLNSLDGYPIEDVGLEIGRSWGVGTSGKDNGLVIVVAPNDRKMRIEVGYGLEGFLTDAHAGRIRDGYMLPYFKQGDYNQGIVNGTVACAQAIAKGYGVKLSTNYNLPEPVPASEEFGLFHLIFLIIFITLCIKYPDFMLGFVLGNLLGGGRNSDSGFGGGFGGFGGGGFGGGGCSGGW